VASDTSRGVDPDGKSELSPQTFETLDSGFRLITETECFALMQFLHVQRLLQYFGGEGAGCHAGELAGEGKNQHGVDAGGCEQLQFFGQRADERQARLWPNDPRGMGIEGDRDGRNA
jgi:hypothetical protein